MISSWGRRGKGMGSLIGRWCRGASPSRAHGQACDLGAVGFKTVQ
jgi:hypothetical protein